MKTHGNIYTRLNTLVMQLSEKCGFMFATSVTGDKIFHCYFKLGLFILQLLCRMNVRRKQERVSVSLKQRLALGSNVLRNNGSTRKRAKIQTPRRSILLHQRHFRAFICLFVRCSFSIDFVRSSTWTFGGEQDRQDAAVLPSSFYTEHLKKNGNPAFRRLCFADLLCNR